MFHFQKFKKIQKDLIRKKLLNNLKMSIAGRRNFNSVRNHSSIFTNDEEQRIVNQNKELEKQLHELNMKHDIQDKENLRAIQKLEDQKSKEEYNIEVLKRKNDDDLMKMEQRDAKLKQQAELRNFYQQQMAEKEIKKNQDKMSDNKFAEMPLYFGQNQPSSIRQTPNSRQTGNNIFPDQNNIPPAQNHYNNTRQVPNNVILDQNVIPPAYNNYNNYNNYDRNMGIIGQTSEQDLQMKKMAANRAYYIF